MSDRHATTNLVRALQDHYIAPSEPLPGGVFAPEVGINGANGGRRCDGVYVGFTSTSGRVMVGHEIKASRADWLHELNQPDKADWWHDNCHRWYLVAPSLDIIPKAEVPAGWGLMVPNPRAKRRMTIAVPATTRDVTPSWDAVRSVLSRLDTLRAQQVAAQVRTQMVKARADMEDRLTRTRSMNADGLEVQKLRRLVTGIEEHFGVILGEWDQTATPSGPGQVTPATLSAAIELVKQHQLLENQTKGARYYAGLPEAIRSGREALELLERTQSLIGDLSRSMGGRSEN